MSTSASGMAQILASFFWFDEANSWKCIGSSTQFGMLLAEESKWTRWGCHIQRKKIKLAKRKCNWINLTH